VPFVEPLEHATIGEVRVERALADRSRYPGYAKFDGFYSAFDSGQFVQSAQPCLSLGREWIDFYSSVIVPTREKLDDAYQKPGKGPSQVFPIRVRSAVELKDMPREGLLEGFAWYARDAQNSWAVRIVR